MEGQKSRSVRKDLRFRNGTRGTRAEEDEAHKENDSFRN